MNNEISELADRRLDRIVNAAIRCDIQYKGFLTTIRHLAELVNWDAKRVLYYALGNADKRMSECAISDWVDSVKDGLKRDILREIETSTRSKERRELVDRLGITPEMLEILNGDK